MLVPIIPPGLRANAKNTCNMKANIPNRFPSLFASGLFALLFSATLADAAARTFTFEDNFDSYVTSTAVSLPQGSASAAAATGYYYKLESDGLFQFSSNSVLTGLSSGNGSIPGYGKKLSLAFTGNYHRFLLRDLRQGSNALGAAEALLSPTVSVDTAWKWGTANATNMRSYIGLLNADNQGYAVSVGRDGMVRIYQVDALSTTGSGTGDNPTGWTLLDSKALSFSQAGWSSPTLPENNTITFSVTETSLVVTTSITGTNGNNLTYNFSGSPAYDNLSQILLGARMNGNEHLMFDNLSLTTIPESSAVALLAGGAMLLSACFLRRK